MSSNQQVGAVGIDFGSSRSVIAVAKKGGVDVIANQASSRETFNIVGYGEKERYMGEQGAARAKSNFKNTCSFSGRLLGLSADYPKLKEESKWITSKFFANEQKELVYEVMSKGEKKQFTPIQVTASMLGELRKIIAFNDINNKEAVISVPSYWTEMERKALLDAAKLADLKVFRILDESSAITLSYGLFRKADLPEKNAEARNVVFVDVGHSKLSAFVSSFSKEKCQILLQQHDRHLGARDFDWTLLKFYDGIFQKSSGGLSIMENKKSILRCLDAIQKQRKILSANSHATIGAECLVEDCDLNYDMCREEFEKLIQPDLERVRECLQSLGEQIAKKGLNIHSVEIIGGASRTPAIQALIKEVFQQEICRTLNQSECISRGCAMMAAYLSPQFKVLEYQLDECNNYPIGVQWTFLNNGNMQEEGKVATLFDKGCSIPNIKSLSFNRCDGIQLDLFYSPPPIGFPREIASVKISAIQPKEKDFSIKPRVKLNHNGLVEFIEAQLIEKYQVEEKVLKENKSKKDGDEDEYEMKIKDKTRTSNVDVQISDLYQLSTKQTEEQFNIEQEMITHDRIIMETNNKRNELETYIYEANDKSTGVYKDYIDPAVVTVLQNELQQTRAWLDNEGQDSSKGQYSAKVDALRALFDPVINRFQAYEALPHAFQQIEGALTQFESFVASTDAQFEHISAEARKPIADEANKIRQRLQQAQSTQSTLAKHQDPAISVAEIQNLGNALIKISTPIMNTPVPKKEEKKVEEEQKQEGQATEQKTEEQQQAPEQKSEKMEVE